MGIDPFFMKYSNMCLNKEVVVVVNVRKDPERGDQNEIKEVRQVQGA